MENRHAGQETPIFSKTLELLVWLQQVSNHFPRVQRYFLTQRILETVFDLSEYLEEANHRRAKDRLDRLERADETLDKLRMYIRMVWRLSWISDSQYGHAAGMLVEVGRLLGGWKKVTAY